MKNNLKIRYIRDKNGKKLPKDFNFNRRNCPELGKILDEIVEKRNYPSTTKTNI